jgi:hypothetical protein
MKGKKTRETSGLTLLVFFSGVTPSPESQLSRSFLIATGYNCQKKTPPGIFATLAVKIMRHTNDVFRKSNK